MVAQGGVAPPEDPGRAFAFFLRVDAAGLAELGRQTFATATLRGSLSAAAATGATCLLLTLVAWIVLTGFGLAVSPTDLLGAGLVALATGWVGACLAIPLIRRLAPQLPGLAALGAYALPGVGLLAAAFIWVAQNRFAIVTNWGRTERPWSLTDLQALLGREEQVWAVAFVAVMITLLIAVPLWLRIWLRLSPRSPAPESRYAAPESDLLSYHDRVRATRVEAGSLHHRPRAEGPGFAGRDDITVVERNRRRRLPAWLVATSGANSILGKPALVLFLACLLLRAFLTDPGLERFPSYDRAIFNLDNVGSEQLLTVPLGPGVTGARLYALSGRGLVQVHVPLLFDRGPETFRFEPSDPPPHHDIDLRRPEPGRGEIVLHSDWPGRVRMELRVMQEFATGDLALGLGLAIANAVLIVAGVVLIALGIANLRSYLAG